MNSQRLDHTIVPAYTIIVFTTTMP